ncbi:beta-ketoacyl-ACP synthase III [Deinococcus peraridilitoris]|uniref:Beta-ketoacyl-[acyl-carrier-protein] synthase III n=1 Tax=Deinococcus peraridilitoris (strain DSM 19664 / LMG 22246 / CIP 109416 / KR-200) TaxID=937777 RepID=L0A0Z5_DEIPD|nr:beta-ketoacyl-ACP synthase III [Deinococcus peraridilitoris]AFZ66665.1 3-oxoacyl-(acyl-carrier-protein) synthase III [Deinococcus peraridilitoris DSM 19664]
MAVGITALGSYAPERTLTNQHFEQLLDTTDEWIVARTGIEKRHIAAEDEFTSQVAIRAVENLIARSGQDALDGVDMVIVATSTPDALFPATASLVQAHFKLTAGTFDMLTACTGWVYALSVAHAYVQAGLCKKVLTIGAETLSRVIDWQDRSTAVLFGDGASAGIVEEVREGYGFRSWVLGADGEGAGNLHLGLTADKLPDGTSLSDKIQMNGREVFKFAVRVMNTATLQAVSQAGLEPGDISLFVPHQANARIIEAARERLGLPQERVVVTVNEYGNNSTASVGLALQHALDAGRIQDGDHLLLVAFGGGLTWGATVLTWGGVLPKSEDGENAALAPDVVRADRGTL